jgi:hypothetical protein
MAAQQEEHTRNCWSKGEGSPTVLWGGEGIGGDSFSRETMRGRQGGDPGAFDPAEDNTVPLDVDL